LTYTAVLNILYLRVATSRSYNFGVAITIGGLVNPPQRRWGLCLCFKFCLCLLRTQCCL